MISLLLTNLLVLPMLCSRFATAEVVSSTTTSSPKLETLPSTAQIIPEQYVAIFSHAIDVSDFVHALPIDDNGDPILNIQFMYNHTAPSSTAPLRGVAVSNVSNAALQWLLESDLIVSVTPVRNGCCASEYDT
jgi:hypothetical protein